MMSEYAIATGSTCDLDAAWLNEHDVPFISYTFTVNGKEYKDDCRPETKVFVKEQMDADQMVTTAAIPVYGYMEFFADILKQGKDIIFMDMTKALSSSHNNALLAARELMDTFPDRRIEIIDSTCVTLQLGVVIMDCVKMRDAGKSMDEVIDWINENQNMFNGRFMVNDLKWLRRGGRLSNASAIVGSLLSVKPLIRVDEEGKLVAYNKVRGHQKCVKTLLEDIGRDMCPETKDHHIGVVYSGDDEEGQEFYHKFRELYPEYTDIGLYRLGPVIMGHIGPGFLAVVVYSTGRHA